MKSTPEAVIQKEFTLESGRNRIEIEVLSFISSEFGEEVSSLAVPIVKRAVQTRPGIGIEPVIQLETRRSELKGTVGLDFLVDLGLLPMGQLATLLVKDPKFYVRVESQVRLTPKRLRLKVLGVRLGFSAQPIGEADATDVHWGKTFRA